MRLVTARVSGVLPFVLFATFLYAQQSPPPTPNSLPRVVPVSGVFVPANGEPAGRVETVTVAIYAGQEGGPSIWQETQQIAVDERGRYSLLVGATRPDGIPPAVIATGAEWLGILFERAGEVERPRVRLTSVPYALRASDADTLGGRPASDYLLATPPGSAAVVGTSVQNPDVTGPEAVLPGLVNYVAKYVNSADVGPSTIYDSGGGVGIGTTAPFDNLHVRFTNTNGALTGFAVQNLGNSPTSYSGMLFYDQNGSLAQFQGFNNLTHEYRINNVASGGTINFMINGVSRFLVGNNGDVTIQSAILKGGKRFLWDGVGNTGVGLGALNSVTTSAAATNTAVGAGALQSLTAGGGNVAVGESALNNLSSGFENTAIGYASLSGATGGFNVALGATAGQNQTGSGNIFIGSGSGANQTGSGNLYVGSNTGQTLNENQTVRIGGYTRIFVNGVRAVTTGNSDAVAVVIDSLGQFGTINSSRRYKEDIQDMGDASSRLMDLRPVTFRYKQPSVDGRKPIDYGLIAEEVEAVYPDLVAHTADGEVETVQYQKINAMLLNEVQKQHRELQEQKIQIDALRARLTALEHSKQ